ncbi:hypothetical protein [Salipaludibacillus aurantiacus]|uniref:hypothetical protein n=1 Tax=Salipaludibacillus aurantiacus TaxID=1601833 RepID=UPI0015A644CD|nr:hypothetical protein [Salipaludibacillus aurantiacus]
MSEKAGYRAIYRGKGSLSERESTRAVLINVRAVPFFWVLSRLLAEYIVPGYITPARLGNYWSGLLQFASMV